MGNTLIEKIVDNLDTVFRGDAWHGPSVMEIINSLPPEKVNQNHHFSKQTISQHIYHLYAWRVFVIEKLNENIHYSLETELENWGSVEETATENFKELVQKLQEKHRELVNRLYILDDQILERVVPGEYYTYYKLLNGLIQHDTYHLGMIWVLWQ
jgi:uncharacterized damage-inducible protein DinB